MARTARTVPMESAAITLVSKPVEYAHHSDTAEEISS